ncbi:hypothetical protein ALP64_201687 [Pseudomonas syringae pv. actinidiae]|uniref:Uncharacterized protein n=2 Tax=Pseudomonas syringae TaxID=317 RepID=A0A656JJH6_PSESF|nr:hypothetical protein A260_15608 [Pseudomonas syringae pv. actinidiae ICMP 19068]EPN31001.1 hypothetical protein A245_45128 [Pseudomonas syringae pv. actinidiae ICMP 19096]RMS53465.1 hypothetical protein ALP64_201687 [Pseudomonas syringae pv. actinidiae]BBI41501.1 hypothetical protein KPSA1B_100202 [Pseudomonas syringae pv. actinidiae]
MSNGMMVWGADSALQLDETSFTIRVVLSTLVTFSGAAKTSQDFAVPGVGPGNGVAIVIPSGTYDNNQRQHETELVDGVARVYNHTRTYGSSTVSSGTMRLIVMRFS